MTKILVNSKDAIIMKLLHYFITEENYKPIILTGVQNEIWLENLDKDLKLIRINVNYIHNSEQFEVDLKKANHIMKNIKRKTFSFKMNLLNILVDLGDTVKVRKEKDIESIKVNKVTDIKKSEIVKTLFPSIKEKLSNTKTDPMEFIKLTEQMNEKTRNDEKKLNRIFKNKKPVITYSLIAINLIIYLLMTFPRLYSTFMYFGANNYVYVQFGGFYRLFTSMFLHANLYHIAFNMYALYIIGPQVEKYFGRLKFILIYLISGILGSLFSCVFMESTSLSIGASGAIFGLFGSLAYFTYKYRATLNNFLRSSILPTIFINLILGFLLPNVDVSAHVGGLIGGVLTSLIVGVEDKKRKTDQINGIIVLILMIAFLIYMLMIKQ